MNWQAMDARDTLVGRTLIDEKIDVIQAWTDQPDCRLVRSKMVGDFL